MRRRDFVVGSGASLLSFLNLPMFAQQVADCCANLPKNGVLTPLKSITVSIDYVKSYGDLECPDWQPAHKQKIEEARLHFAQVWSSAEFKTAVTTVDEFIWQGKKMMSGADLYSKLMRTSEKKMKCAAGERKKNELAISYPGGETLIELHYLNDKTARISDFVHTLSHEYTHYIEGVESWDRGHSRVVINYVSYGIGCITQHLAFPNELCGYEVDTKVTPARPGGPDATKAPEIEYTFRQALPHR